MTNENITIRESVTLRGNRCLQCGGFWMIESWRAGRAICPICSGRLNADKNEVINRLAHQIAGLKGALKRLKKNQ